MPRSGAGRLAAAAAFASVAAATCFTVVLLGRPGPADAGAARPQLARITATTSIAALARHFGHPSATSFHAGSQTDIWVSREHDWTIVRYIHPRPRPGGS